MQVGEKSSAPFLPAPAAVCEGARMAIAGGGVRPLDAIDRALAARIGPEGAPTSP